MARIKYSIATKEDRKKLLRLFGHYGNKKIVERRIECYLAHNFTVIARDNDKIAGVLQWYPKEEPSNGAAEIEELYVLADYRGRGIGSNLIIDL